MEKEIKSTKTVTRLIDDISFGRFLREFKYYVQKHPDAKLIGQDCGDDERAENAFMFRAKIEYSEEK